MITKKKKIIIDIISEEYSKKDKFMDDMDDMNDLFKKHNVHSFCFYKSEKEPPILLNTHFAKVHNYADENKLKEKVEIMNKNNDIVYIATPLKENVALVKELKKLV
jgi:hypothetical protein